MTSKQPSEMNLEQLKISDAKEDPKHFDKKIGNEPMLNIPDALGREPGKVNPTGRGDGKKSEETEDRGEKEKGKPAITETYDEPNWEKEKNASQRDVNDNEHDGPKGKIDEVSITRPKELGKYCERTEFTNEKGRPQEKGRVLGAGEVDIIRICAGCGKRMSKVKASLVCTCKLAIHCSRDCFKSSNHNCKEPFVENIPGMKTNPEDNDGASHELHNFVKFNEAVKACHERFLANRKANKGPSSDKVASLVKTTLGEHRRILNYAERANHPVAAYVVGRAYMERVFDRRAVYAIPVLYKEKSVTETNEIAVKWLKVAAEAGVPEAMFCLFLVLMRMGDLKVDPRVPENWLARAHATGEMDYLIQILQIPNGNNFPSELDFLYNSINENCEILEGQNLACLLLATRFRELKAWDGKTALGEPFYGFPFFKSILESIGELKNDQARPSIIDGKKKTIVVISARPGYSDSIEKLKREENNLKFLQGVKQKISLDYQLLGQTSNVGGRTSHLISCAHDQVSMEEGAQHIEYKNVVLKTLHQGLIDWIKKYKTAGKCESCVIEAKQRLRAVSLGQFSISLTPLLINQTCYIARYANDNGVIVQDVFDEYSKPYMRQVLQCLMSNPPDLHPLAVAEHANLFWPIIWFWGSVYGAVEDTCNIITLHAIYGSLSDKSAFAKSENASALAAFPEVAAGEWRIACGNEDCPKVDHEVKFNLCAGCKVRRYCNETCQKKDWAKHMTFCKANRKGKK